MCVRMRYLAPASLATAPAWRAVVWKCSEACFASESMYVASWIITSAPRRASDSVPHGRVSPL